MLSIGLQERLKTPCLMAKLRRSCGAGGGVSSARAQYQLRQICVYVNLYLLNRPEIFSNAFSGSSDDAGNLIDPNIQKQIKQQLQTSYKRYLS